MKRVPVMLMAVLLIASLAACGEKTADNTQAGTQQEERMIVGGWEVPASVAITDEVKAVTAKATEGLTGAEYTPVAYLGSQVVAGTNHRILCKKTTVTQEPVTNYSIITVYEKLDGTAEITEVLDCKTEPGESGLSGGWEEPESPVVTDEAKNALNKADKSAGYKPLALLATQVVSGTNYRLLCVTGDSEPHYAVVTVYEDLQGNAEITETAEFSAAA